MELALQHNPFQQFTFNERYPIRVIDREGDPWFIAVDVCEALEIANVAQAVNRLDDDERDIYSVYGRPMLIISESGLYSLILTSRKDEAKAFKRWITHEVIPAIRKHGAYLAKSASPLDILEAMIHQLRKQEQINVETNRRLSDIEIRQTAIESGTEYFTVIAFANRHGIRVDNTKALNLGKHAGRYSRKHGYPIGQAPDSRFGHVNTYHEDVLRAVFGIAA